VIAIWSGCALIVTLSETWNEIGLWIWSGFGIENVSETLGFPTKQKS